MHDSIPGAQKLSEADVRDAMFDAVAAVLPDIRQAQFLYKYQSGTLLDLNQIKDFIVQKESAREEAKELDRAGITKRSSALTAAVRHPDVCMKCGNKRHATKDCTRLGQMCYRCHRYENHTAKACPYSDEEIASKDFKYTKTRGNFKNYNRNNFNARNGGGTTYK